MKERKENEKIICMFSSLRKKKWRNKKRRKEMVKGTK